jgi:hypothetical protein
MFPPTSRYYSIPTASLTGRDGRVTVYVRRRFVPASDRFATLLEHTVTQSDRLDNIAAQYLGDPEQFWRIADANSAMQPDDLVRVAGRKLRITLPEGIPGKF